MSKSLISLANEAHVLKMQIIESEGELTPELEAALTVSEKSLIEKSDSYKYVMDDLNKYAELLKEKEDQVKKARQALENFSDKLKNNIKQAMIAYDKSEIHGSDYVFKLSNSKPSLVIDEKILPKHFKHQVVTENIDKEKIMEEIKLTGFVDGCELKETKALKITINKGLK